MLHHRVQLILALSAMLWLFGFIVYAKADDRLVIMTDEGGSIVEYVARKNEFAKSGKIVEIKGTCPSACTVYLALPNACVHRNAWLGFHQTGSTNPQPEAIRLAWDRYLWSQYHPAIQEHVRRLGPDIVWYRGHELPIPQCK